MSGVIVREADSAGRARLGFTGRFRFDATKPNGQPRRRLDVSRALDRFGFSARTDFQTGLQRTIDWYELEYGRGRLRASR